MVERITKHVPFAQIIYFFIIKSISTAEILPGNSQSIVRNINTAILLYFLNRSYPLAFLFYSMLYL